MATTREPVRIAINVMRSRLTILGFNLAIITFQLSNMRELHGGVVLPGIDVPINIPAAASLFLGLALTLAAMVSFLASGATDSVGICDHWSLLLGDMLMYMALAQTVAGFFGPFQFELGQVELSELVTAREFADIHVAISVSGGIAWAAAHYVGPAVSLLRSPFGRRINLAMAGFYALLVLTVAWVSTTAWRLQAQLLGLDEPVRVWLVWLAAPLYW